VRTRSVVAIVAVFALLAAGAAAWRAANPRPAHAQDAASPPAAVFQRAKGSYAPPASDTSPLSILVIGSDYRPGEAGCGCADSLHLLTVNPTKRAATILGFPRDSWVDVPGFGHQKINTALQLGGPELVVATVQAVTGIPIDYFLLTDFQGFSRMVDGIGGITVDVPYAMNDPYSGAVFSPGRTKMKGGHALSFARNRHGTPGGDIGRSENQGLVLLGALEKLRADFEHDPAMLVSWVAVGMRHLRTDLSLNELARLALAAARIPTSSVRNLVVPASIGTVGAASVVFISPSAAAVFSDLREDGILNR
jgi:LCP family protein required for cell wall assembly